MSDSLVNPWTVTCQAPLTMGFSRQEYWSGLPFPSLGDLSDQGLKLRLLHWQMNSLLMSQQGSSFIPMAKGKLKAFICHCIMNNS